VSSSTVANSEPPYGETTVISNNLEKMPPKSPGRHSTPPLQRTPYLRYNTTAPIQVLGNDPVLPALHNDGAQGVTSRMAALS